VKDALKVCTTKAPQSQPKQHMSAELLSELVSIHDQQKVDWLAERNIVLLLVMMSGMLRESEATQLTLEDVEFQLTEEAPAAAAASSASSSSSQKEQSMVLWIGRSKTDQAGKGTAVMIAANSDSPVMCPVRRLRQYLQMRQTAGIESAFVFSTKNGTVMAKSTPCGIVQRLVENANQLVAKKTGTTDRWGPSKSYGSHSLRRGGVTEARRNGADMLEIQRHGRWKSAVVWDYVGPTVEQRLSVTRQLFAPSTASAPVTPKKFKFKARDPMTPNCEPWTMGRGQPWNRHSSPRHR
jgi:Phage integrase family